MKLDVEETPITVPGFRFAGVSCGIKPSGKLDLALIASDVPAVAAGVTTKNKVKAAPVQIAMSRLQSGRAQAILINSGNANACTGEAGYEAAKETCQRAARALGLSAAAVVPCSTGKIGVPLPMRAMARGIDAAADALEHDGWWRAARAIMTTDAFPKAAMQRVKVAGRTVTIAGMAKGAGMIAPDMATLLVALFTDAEIDYFPLKGYVDAAVASSFNAITVDGDCSTNDTLVMLANGAAQNRPFAPSGRDGRRFQAALTELMETLADMVVADGEGATKKVHITVTRARSAAEARIAAKTIAQSLLVKTALFGGYPNFGRIACAAGYAGVHMVGSHVSVGIGDVWVLKHGVPEGDAALKRAAATMKENEFTITVDLANTQGRGTATVTTSDIGTAYVNFNSAYST